MATPVWDMPYADGPGVASQSPEQLRKMMGVVVVVCAALGFAVPEVEAEIVCLRTKRMPGSATIFSVEVAGQVYNHSFVYLGGNVNHNADLSIEVDRCIRNA